MDKELKPALIMFAKMPVPGSVKTRLAPSLSPQEAAELYRCMLEDSVAKVRELSYLDTYLFYSDEAGARLYFEHVAVGMKALPQKGIDLGERMETAFGTLFEMGYRSIAIIGSDSPDLPLSFIRIAYERLQAEAVDAVFGPSDDGGYYLLGMKRLQSPLFRGIEWSGSDVLKRSLMIAADEEIGIALLPKWHDVDTAEALMRPELMAENNGAPLTRAFIRRWLHKPLSKLPENRLFP